ncbi:MAG: anti-sigma factor [Acidobacteria bacterium]|nr:MAG: anti-sigma factor [Acidobacteriota bacterium]
MSCVETQNLIQGYSDGELDLINNLRMEEHLKDCPSCERDYENLRTLRSSINRSDLYFNAPADLRRRVHARVHKSVKDEPKRSVLRWRWLAAAASFALIAIIIFVLVLIQSGSSRDDLLAQEIVSSHVRSLMASHLTDVQSTDQHTVKPWFDGKLDYSPQATDLTAHGFPLVGGRLDYIGNRPVAALIYQRRQHIINLFIWPSTDDHEGRNRMSMRQGYNLIHWNRAGMTYWAVSDLNINELQEFAQALQNP